MSTFVDSLGTRIHYDRVLPEGEPRGAVHVLHGVGEHAGRYAPLLEALAAAGWAAYADDHRGHGRTGMEQHGSVDLLGRLGKGGHSAAVESAWEMSQLARSENPGKPLIILGHSWGSFLTQKLVNAHPGAYDAVILIGSSLRWPGSLNSGPLNKPWAGPDVKGNEWICEDPAVQDDALADPLTVQKPLVQLFGVLGAAQLFGLPARGLPDTPTLLLVGRDDTVGGPRSVHKLAAAYRKRSGFTDVTTHVYNGRHEILNGFEQATVRADILSWLEAHFPRE
ncbi:alpha/beta hydrolase [Microbacterium sorbitolivorans]|uniref:Alpha/beta fold hydrolase n=1 Tax=Microbacterium sorbitolivorans TaxID=1867410 RepID=A0A367Y469_9MICO|nr:alpha/beta fold hydrolase [Microbacterium sorbitolivorans]RCK59822.1 alpha/beta fold hydrolase [Microbacterium sorbitolivorans]GGF40293.1 alpha/beta hydrolase [Microbacterium sorbitolivorans]